MGRENLMKPVLITAGVIGSIQGLIWTFLSLISIFYYNRVLDIDKERKCSEGLGLTINSTIYCIYLDPDAEFPETISNLSKESDEDWSKPIVDSKNFNIFMYFYFGLSMVWLVNSAIILWGIFRNKLELYRVHLVSLWIGTVCLLSVLDVVLMSLIANDYQQISHNKKIYAPSSVRTVVLTSMGIVMTIAARGYIIWMINIIFAVILIKYCRYILAKDQRPATSIIDAFDSSTRPPWDSQNTLYDDSNAKNFESTNKGFRDDNNEPIYSRSESFHHLRAEPKDHRLDKISDRRSPSERMTEREDQGKSTNNNNYLNNFANSPMNRFSYGPESSQNQDPMAWRAPQIKTAKIGRQPGQRSPPLIVAPPFIPAPDYSPTNSLRVKGVLKPKSQYMYQ